MLKFISMWVIFNSMQRCGWIQKIIWLRFNRMEWSIYLVATDNVLWTVWFLTKCSILMARHLTLFEISIFPFQIVYSKWLLIHSPTRIRSVIFWQKFSSISYIWQRTHTIVNGWKSLLVESTGNHQSYVFSSWIEYFAQTTLTIIHKPMKSKLW